jgi:WD40 repeat protein
LLPLLLILGACAQVLAQAWSPDGTQIAVPGRALRLLDPTGSAPPIQIADTAGAAYPTWSPDGKTLAYLTNSGRIVFLDMMTQARREVGDNSIAPAVWSPDSKKAALFHRTEEGTLSVTLHYRDGGDARVIPLPFPAQSLPPDSAPAWIAATDNLVLLIADGKQRDLYVIEQGVPARLTTTGDVLGFALSADGRRVRYARRSANARYILFSVYELTIQTRAVKKLPFPMTLAEVNPNPRQAPEAVLQVSLSPDLQYLAFVTQGGPEAGAQGTTLYVCDITGKNARPIGRGRPLASTSAAPPGATGWTFPALPPTFSPDSKQLAALRREGGRTTLSLLPVQSSGAEMRELFLPEVLNQ